jgi:hypothetical protein
MTREIPLTQGRVALVDDSDYEAVLAVGKWHLSTCDGRLYAQNAKSKSVIRLHKFLTGWPLVDHVNGDGLDNRRANLRRATASQNSANIDPPSHNTSGYKGVTLYKRTGRWRGHITVDGTQRHLGYFATAEEAARAYDAAALATWGEFARPNFPEERAS